MLSTDDKGRLSLRLKPSQSSSKAISVNSQSREGRSPNEERPLASTQTQPCCGLSNLGNTCYCNAVLQALRHCPGFTETLQRQESAFSHSHRQMELMQELNRLMQEMERTDQFVTPVTFLDILRHNNDQFTGRVQHDAQELLNYILTPKPKQTSRKRKASPPPTGLPDKRLKMETCFNAFQDSASSPQTSCVSTLFQGQLAFLTRCFDCEMCTQKTEPFLHISLPVISHRLPGFPTVVRHMEHGNSSSVAPVSLSWCLSSFMASERLNWSNKFWCNCCGHLVEAERSILFSLLPNIFTVHMNRFSIQDRAVSKVSGSVAVPLSLRLTSWTTQECTSRNSVYGLKAVVLHSGTSCNSGHYTAVVRSAGQWLHCDDESVAVVSDTAVEELLSPLSTSSVSPYILFYCRM